LGFTAALELSYCSAKVSFDWFPSVAKIISYFSNRKPDENLFAIKPDDIGIMSWHYWNCTSIV